MPSSSSTSCIVLLVMLLAMPFLAMGAVLKVDLKPSQMHQQAMAESVAQMSAAERREFMLKRAMPYSSSIRKQQQGRPALVASAPIAAPIAADRQQQQPMEGGMLADDDAAVGRRMQKKKKQQQSGNIPVHYDPFVGYWLQPQGTIQLGTPPQTFTVAFSIASPDTFVASSSVKYKLVEQMAKFDASKSSTYKKPLFWKRWTDSLKRNWDIPNNGTIAKDVLNVGSLSTSLKFGLVDELIIDSSMDWVYSHVDGIFGMSLAKPHSHGIKSTLHQLAPHLDEPAFSSLTILNATHASKSKQYFQIGSTRIEEGQCLPEAYTFVPSTSEDGYHTQLFAIKLVYPNGKVTRFDVNMDMEFTNIATIHYDGITELMEIHGDKPTVDAITAALGGLNTTSGYAQHIPCHSDEPRPSILFELGTKKQKGDWILTPDVYVQKDFFYPDRCLCAVQWHPMFPAWRSYEFHTQFCFALQFGPRGNMIGWATPKQLK